MILMKHCSVGVKQQSLNHSLFNNVTYFLDALYGGWYTYSREWEAKFDSTNILPMYYEGMKKVRYVI